MQTIIDYDKIELGSRTAKQGFKTELVVIEKFNNWMNDTDTKLWLEKMGYNINDISNITAIKLNGYKSDIQLKIKLRNQIYLENIQIKLVSNKKGFNQIDKRWLKKYKKMWRWW